MYACDRGKFELVELLLSKGADPNEAAKVYIDNNFIFYIYSYEVCTKIIV